MDIIPLLSMIDLGIYGYGAVGVLYAFLTLLLIFSWRGQSIGSWLIVCCLISVAWAAAITLTIAGRPVHEFAYFTSEVLRSGAWLTFLTMLLSKLGAGRLLRTVGIAVWAGVLLTGVVLVVAPSNVPGDLPLREVLMPGGLVMALVGLLLVEQLHRNSPQTSQRGIRALVIGLGGLFAYDLFLCSQGMLIGGFEQSTWLARGALNIIFVPFIAVAAKTNREWDLDIFVSRQVVFYSTTLAAVGIYLLLMSAAGYWLVIVGGTWGPIASLVFFIGTGLLLLILIFSNRLRAHLKVFLSKHFFRNKYDYREEWLRLISTLAAFEDSSTRQIVIKALAQIVQSPSGLLWVLDDRQKTFQLVAAYDTPEQVPDLDVTDSLVRFIKQDGWLVDLNEYRHDPDIYGDLEIPDWLLEDDKAWLIVPMITRGELLGLALLAKADGSLKLNYEDRDLLKTVGNHIAVHLAQERTDTLLSEARQFEAYNRLTAFLMHDLNNLLAQQSLILANAAKHKRNPDFVDDAMNTIANSVDRMKRVMDQLKRGAADQLTKATSLKFIVSAAADRCNGREPNPELVFADDGAELEVDAEQFTMILIHLLRNAQDSTGAGGKVVVTTGCSDGKISVAVADDGCGMSAEFIRDRLFRPFDSTKGSQGMGIGAYQAREFARKMGGDLEVRSELRKGTTVTLTIPASREGLGPDSLRA